jgi:hypothetical protein
MGPRNPQALNRYAYVLNNPLRYVDPMGYQGIPIEVELSPEESAELMQILDEAAKWDLISGIGEIGLGLASKITGIKFLSPGYFAIWLGMPAVAVDVILALGAMDMLLTWDDLNNIRIAMGDLQADSSGAEIKLNLGIYGSKLVVKTTEGSRTVNLKNLSFVGSAAPQMLAGTLIGFKARRLLLPKKHYMYMPLVIQ